MFTGIVEKTALIKSRDGQMLEIGRAFDVAVGDSVAVNGVCLTISELSEEGFRVELSEETSGRTTLGGIEAGDQVNLERAMSADGRFGGHLVQGHVDGIVYLMEREQLSGSVEMWFESSPEITRYVVEKGSVTLDGVSLTVSSVKDARFTVAVVPHTLNSTNLRDKRPGDPFNVEVDIIAKYVERLLSHTRDPGMGKDAESADSSVADLSGSDALAPFFEEHKPGER